MPKSKTSKAVLKYHYRTKYRLSVGTYNLLLKAQKDRCAICRQKDNRALSVDHDHDTGIIRGLLCRKCNIGIGYFDDLPKRIQLAAAYLLRMS